MVLSVNLRANFTKGTVPNVNLRANFTMGTVPFVKIIKKHHREVMFKIMPRAGIEPATQGFSVLCSTN